jgi:putative OPT family oligopeptide transporter
MAEAEKEKDYEPYIPADTYMAEMTVRVVIIGLILAVVMGAANAYLGLYVGMTVSATIPAMVMSIAILKFMKGTILEINISKAIAVAGEALAAGIIFTIPALLILYRPEFTDGSAGWENLADNMGIIIIVALLGGFLGILFTIPMRKVMIDDLNLPYPEGVASAEVLKTIVPKDESEQAGSGGMFFIFSALVIAGVFKIASSEFGLNLWKERIEGVAGTGQARFFGGLNLSPALLGVGIILGRKIASLVFMGGLIGWIILIPVIGAIVGWPTTGNYVEDMGPYLGGIYQIWFEYTMYVGIGAIVTGGIYTLIKMRKAITAGIKEGFGSGKEEEVEDEKPNRLEYDLKLKYWYFGVIAVIMGLLYYYVTGDVLIAAVATGMMIIFTFFFTAIAAYLAGVVGSSNNPISGVTVATLLFTAILLLSLGADKNMGMTATIIVGAVVCCSAAIAGDSMQELKTGQLLGATPYNIQIARFLGVAAAAITVPYVVMVLHRVYTIGSPNLPAPQSYVMASIAQGIFLGEMNWAMFVLGIVVALILIYLDLPVMAVAIGIYLPFTLTLPIMIGGLLKQGTDDFAEKKVKLIDKPKEDLDDEECESRITDLKEKINNQGILFASGLIAGEAIIGVIIAAIVIVGIDMAIMGEAAVWPGLLVFGYLMLLLVYILLRNILRNMNLDQVKFILRSMVSGTIRSITRLGRK